MTMLADLLVATGKVRDIYDVGDGALLLVASDRISAFDVVLPTPIPDKGRVLTGMTRFWLDRTQHIVPNHMLGMAPDELPEVARDPALAGRAMLCRKLEMLPVECVVRGYLVGSGFKDYRATGSVSGHALPAGLEEACELPEPLFTPSTKADVGLHDENITGAQAASLVGTERFAELERVSIALYRFAAAHARERGIILADTKFELGIDRDGALVLADEVLTPDSSRYWPADGFEVGHGQPSFDKQFVRDWASQSGWDKAPPAPAIPDDVVAGTRERYIEAYERITGARFADWLEELSTTPAEA